MEFSSKRKSKNLPILSFENLVYNHKKRKILLNVAIPPRNAVEYSLLYPVKSIDLFDKI